MPTSKPQLEAAKKYRKKIRRIEFIISPAEESELNMPEFPRAEAKRIFLEAFRKEAQK